MHSHHSNYHLVVSRFIKNYFLNEEKKGVRWAARVRIVASVAILVFFIFNLIGQQSNASAESRYITQLAIIVSGIFVILGSIQYYLASKKVYLLYLKYIFAVIDVSIIMYVAIKAPIDVFYPFPTPILLQSGVYILFFVLLVTSALTFSPSLVLWTGATLLISWGLTMWVVLGFKENITYNEISPKTDLNFAQEVTLISDPHYVDLEQWGWEMVVIVIVTLILALIVERSRRQVLSQAEAFFEKGVAEQDAEARAEFLATMSHEIRTPLHGLMGMTNLLLETPLNDQQKDYVQTMRFSGEALLSIVNDVLDLSKIEADKLDLHPQRFHFVQMIRGGLMLFEQQLREKDLDYFIDIDPDVPPYLVGDPFRLRQVLLNIISNAIKYTEKGMVGIKVHILGRDNEVIWVELIISDTGIGIQPQDQEKIFQRYRQADVTIEKRYGGTGLGLYISKKIIAAMGGQIRLESEAGKGSQFIVTLPFMMPVDQKQIKSDLFQAVTPLRILIADDNAINRKILQKHLQTQGHHVKTVADGVQVLKALGQDNFDILLLDLDMPIMDGYETARQMALHNEPAFHLPILAVTAGISDAKRKECIKLGIKEIILKPIAFAALDRLIHQYGSSDDKDDS